jgi:ABC-type phosphate transport system substrate-binding protein
VHRSDGSGTTFNLAYFLSDVSAGWKSKVGVNTSVQWPVGIGAKGNEGVANNVAQTKGSIGYVATSSSTARLWLSGAAGRWCIWARPTTACWNS